MNKRRNTAVSILIGLTQVPPCVAQTSQAEKEVLGLEQKMNASYAANDLPSYFADYSPHFTQWLPEGRIDLPQ